MAFAIRTPSEHGRHMAITVTDNMRGAFLMMGAMAAFVVNDTILKAVGLNMPLPQLLAIRGALTTLVLALVAWRSGIFQLRIPRRDRGLILLRTICEVAAAYFFISSLLRLDLAVATAILLVLPLTVALSAAIFLKEPLGWRRLLAILIGFCGMLLIVKPGPSGLSHAAWLALAAVVCITVRDLAARRISKEVPSLTAALAAAFGVSLSGFIAMTGQSWVTVSAIDFGFLVLAAVSVACAYACSVATMRYGEVAFVTPFRYTALLWALILGLIFFGEWPDMLTLIGSAILVATGIFTLYRETRAKAA